MQWSGSPRPACGSELPMLEDALLPFPHHKYLRGQREKRLSVTSTPRENQTELQHLWVLQKSDFRFDRDSCSLSFQRHWQHENLLNVKNVGLYSQPMQSATNKVHF